SGDPVGGLGLSLASVTGAVAFPNLDVFSTGTAVGATGIGGFDLDVTSGAGQFVATAGPALSLSTLDAGIQNALFTSTTSTTPPPGRRCSLPRTTGRSTTARVPGGRCWSTTPTAARRCSSPAR